MDSTATLAAPQPIAAAERLYAALQGLRGHRILLAQQESPLSSAHEQEMDYLYRVTGQLPAIRGLDFIHNDFAGVVERALRWRDRGGLVTICWHTGVAGIGYPESKEESPDFSRLLTPDTAENRMLTGRWEEAANALLRLQAEEVPVLWRPFHEFDGRWFWWGKGGPEAFIRLWRAMFDQFAAWGLRNLIWVLGYADDVLPGWYPGDAYCDVPGSDTYRGETTHTAAFRLLQEQHPDRPLAFHESGQLPPPEAFLRDGAHWSWLMPWHGPWLVERNSLERLRAVYGHEQMLTLDRFRAMGL